MLRSLFIEHQRVSAGHITTRHKDKAIPKVVDKFSPTLGFMKEFNRNDVNF
jgi:hypothetical protein